MLSVSPRLVSGTTKWPQRLISFVSAACPVPSRPVPSSHHSVGIYPTAARRLTHHTGQITTPCRYQTSSLQISVLSVYITWDYRVPQLMPWQVNSPFCSGWWLILSWISSKNSKNTDTNKTAAFEKKYVISVISKINNAFQKKRP